MNDHVYIKGTALVLVESEIGEQLYKNLGLDFSLSDEWVEVPLDVP